MENQIFNFQINPDNNRKAWDNIHAHSRTFQDWVTAVHFAKRLARIFKGEVRLTTGNPDRASGAYFYYKQDC